MTGFEASLDVGPVINRDFAGFVKGLAAGEFLLVPRRRHDVTERFRGSHGRKIQ